MKKFILLLAAAVVAGFALQAKTADEFRIYLNPGHGSYGANDRPMKTIGHPNTGVLNAEGQEHLGRDFSSVRAALRPMDVLAAKMDVGALNELMHGAKIHERRAHDHVTFGVLDEGNKLADQGFCLLRGLVHLPVTGNDILTHCN